MQENQDKPKEEYEGGLFIKNLRDNLSQQDKPVAFLFGAGTSCAVQVSDPNDSSKKKPLIPDIVELTRICKEEVEKLGDEYEKAWGKIEEKSAEKENLSDVEYMLSRLAIMLEVLENSEKEETLVGLNAEELKKMERKIRETIATKANLKEEEIPNALPHKKFARWIINTKRAHPVEIFTVNYDTLLERAFEAERVPVFDGFVGSHKPFFYPESLQHEEWAPGSNWARLWKIHGSVSWRRESKGRYVRIIRKEINDSEKNDIFPGEMIFPSLQKYDDSRQQPYVSFLDKLAEFLKKDNALLITIGFSFRDRHINKLIFDALKNKPTTNLYSLQYKEDRDASSLFKKGHERKNITIIYPESIVVGGKFKKLNWDSKNLHGIDLEKNLSHVTDFNVFCNFIESIIPYDVDSQEMEANEAINR